MRPVDVAIAGAGPAGAVAARELARAGARVVLIDGSHPREKPCGGGVTGRALDLAGMEISGGRVVEAVTFEAGTRSASVPLPDDRYLRVHSRAVLDAALVQQARDAGAEIVPARLTAFARSAGRWTLQAGADTLEAPWLLGADGAAGLVRKRVFRPFERRQLSIAAGAFVAGAVSHTAVIAFVDRPRGYLWSFPRREHLAVGTCAQADETSSVEMHAITDRWLDGYAQMAGLPRRRYSWSIPSLSAADVDAEQPSGDGWMLLGDAAGLVDPITREGIYFAMRSGELAAQALGSASPAAAYAERVRGEIHAELRRAARLKAGFYRPCFTRLLVDAVNSSEAIQAVLLDLVAGRQPYAGLKRRLLGTLEIGWMLRLLTAS